MTQADLLTMVDGARDELIALCQALVQVPSVSTGVMPTGNETAAANVIRRTLAAEGIESELIEAAPNRGSVIARLRGSNGAPRLLLLSHTDVVPVEDEAQWRFPPFSATLHDNRIWGRGANDMKSTVAAQAMALIILKRSGIQLRGDLIFAAGADEESGGDYGFRWLAENVPDKLRADYALNEGGGGLVQAPDGRMAYLVSTGEKGRLEITITVTGRGFHASQPWRADNAIYKAQEVVRRIASYAPELHVDTALIGPLADLYGVQESVTADNVDRIAAQLEAAGEVTWGSSLKALTRMTLVATMIQAGVKSNSIAETCVITCDARILPHQDKAYVARQIQRLIDGLDGVAFSIRYTAVPSASPYDDSRGSFVDRLKSATCQSLGQDNLQFVPSLTVGFTDSRLVRGLTPVIYGFLPRHPNDDPRLGGAHNINESASVESMVLSTKVFVTLAADLLAADQ